MIDIFDQVISIFNYINVFFAALGRTEFIETVRLFGVILIIVLTWFIVVLLFKVDVITKIFKGVRNFLLPTFTFKKQTNKLWQNVLSRLNKNDDASLKLAIIEADNLFDGLLKQMGLPGESMADRLKYINPAQISNLNEIWLAHKLRNEVVHNHVNTVSRSEIEFAIRAYEKALKELEYID